MSDQIRDSKGKRLDTIDLMDRVDIVAADATKRAIADNWRRDILLNSTPSVLSAGTWTNNGVSGFAASITSAPYTETWYTDVSPGTWAFDIYMTKASNAAIVDFHYSIDAGANWIAIATNVDLFGSGVSITTGTGFVIAAAGRLDFRIRSTGTKNASSTNYFMVSNNVTLRRTA